MPKVKVKRKSTFIDMTAMSDVTVLLLTFFMLTSNFIKKEPVQVTTPSSVNEEKIPETNVMTVLIDPTGHVYMALAEQKDKERVLERVGKEFTLDGKPITFSQEELYQFSLLPSFGVPIREMNRFLALTTEMQDEEIKKLGGIPTDSINNQFKVWVRNARDVNPNLIVAIKADATTPYSVIKDVMNTLQDLSIYKYNLITSLKTASTE